MKIVTWNCNGAFRKKFRLLKKFNADIIVIQECEDPAQSADADYKEWASRSLWMGDNRHKGLGIFCTDMHTLKNNAWESNGTKHFISANVDGVFDLVAVWNHHANSPNFRYIGQLWKYLQINKGLMTNAFITGDFNSNSIWDEWDRWWNHSDVVRELSELGIRSLYHEYFGEEQGKERTPTFYLHRNLQKPYHTDYAFAASKLFSKIANLTVGDVSEWLLQSDHMPIVVEV